MRAPDGRGPRHTRAERSTAAGRGSHVGGGAQCACRVRVPSWTPEGATQLPGPRATAGGRNSARQVGSCESPRQGFSGLLRICPLLCPRGHPRRAEGGPHTQTGAAPSVHSNHPASAGPPAASRLRPSPPGGGRPRLSHSMCLTPSGKNLSQNRAATGPKAGSPLPDSVAGRHERAQHPPCPRRRTPAARNGAAPRPARACPQQPACPRSTQVPAGEGSARPTNSTRSPTHERPAPDSFPAPVPSGDV